MRLRIFVEPQQGARYSDILNAARAAEELGFDGFFSSDHLLAMAGAPGFPGPTDVWTTLAGLARETRRIRLGTLVSAATFRHPGLLALQVAQVDDMSEGRIEFGLGAAWYEEEHRTTGLPFPDVRERFDRLEEQLDIITGLWALPLGQRYTKQGRHYQIIDSPGLPKPRQHRMPVIVGGVGRRRTPALAARYATEYNSPFTSAADTKANVDNVRAACHAIGRDPGELRFSVALGIACGARDSEVIARAAPAGIPFERFQTKHLAGSADQVAHRLGTYRKAGCEAAYLQLPDFLDLDHIHYLGSELQRQLDR
ncbi:LLM class F420-dependent oxidoreductase [Nonomuraea sp. MG754425]|uniref:LLM class F420-dependent oxidoreductase n=1 Tax=Nonomuraea sp. MG754425 TaxID=2570319 RepID=UPI001F3028BE|nr:LLM class F420-dependent oxidoreductase [Nonomuraea sp. MG754425]MCF6473403.1 LLM class F420-dependent oxidoreductase [Nonomuraea sp. MG754425]